MSKNNKTENWILFLDETGEFKKTTNKGIVAGLLIRESNDINFDHALKETLKKLLPFLPFPFHTTFLNQAAYWPYCWGQNKQKWTGQWAEYAKKCEATLDFIKTIDHPNARLYSDHIENDEKISYDLIYSVSRLMQNSGYNHKILRNLSYIVKSKIKEILVTITSKLDPEGYFIAAAAPCEPSNSKGDLYMLRLGALLERIVAMLRTTEKTRAVKLEVARRNISIHSLAQFPLVPQLINNEAVAALKTGPFATSEASFSPLLKINTNKVWDANYDPLTPAGVIFADFICNLLGKILYSETATVAQLQSKCSEKIGLPIIINAHDAQLPTITAQGYAQEILKAAFKNDNKNIDKTIRPNWAREQLDMWLKITSNFYKDETTRRPK